MYPSMFQLQKQPTVNTSNSKNQANAAYPLGKKKKKFSESS